MKPLNRRRLSAHPPAAGGAISAAAAVAAIAAVAGRRGRREAP